MNIAKTIAELRTELEQVDTAILALERILRLGGKRRGRPPKWLAEAKPEEPTETKSKKKRVLGS